MGSRNIRARVAQATPIRTTSKPATPNGHATAEPETDTRNRRMYRDKLLKYLLEHPMEVVFLDTLVEIAEGKTNGVQSAMHNLVKNIPQIERMVGGKAWRWNPDVTESTGQPEPANAQPTRRMFEEIGQTREGDLVIQDDTGTLYRATAL